MVKNEKIDVIITTGGTGLTGRDITPEALDEIADKDIPGFGEVFRNISLKTVGTSAIQSRACAVLSNGKYVFALPGSSGGVTDAWEGILKHQLDIKHKPCNFVTFSKIKKNKVKMLLKFIIKKIRLGNSSKFLSFGIIIIIFFMKKIRKYWFSKI